MQFIKIKTRPILPPQDDLYKILDQYLPPLQNGDVLVITSKILAIHQGRCVKISPEVDKDKLILQEADGHIPRSRVPDQMVILTLKGNTLIPTSGIDESNGNGYYVLWPEKIQELCEEIWQYLKNKNNLEQLGIITTDSHTMPLRYGTVGTAIGFFGIEPLFDYRGKKDIFGRELKMTQASVVEGLAATAVMLMGEGAEQTPMLLFRGLNFVQFTDQDVYAKSVIPPELDIYKPLLDAFQKDV